MLHFSLKLFIAISFVGMFFIAPATAKEQPIKFSHKLHVGQNGVACQYCHIYARRSYSSGVPSVTTCVGCHGTQEQPVVAPESEEVNKMRAYWAKQEPIPWVKLHDVPDFVRFPHKKHINADSNRIVASAGTQCDEANDPRSWECRIKLFKAGGDTRCTACHGKIQEMEVIQTGGGLFGGVDKDFGGMGWCLTCHLAVKGTNARKAALSTLDGWFHAKQMDIDREKMIGLKNEKGYHNPNLTDCFTCHY